MTRAMTTVLANAFVADDDQEGEFGYWIEGEPVSVEIEHAYDEEIRVGVMVPGRDFEVVGLYFSPSSARDLIVGLGAAIKDLES